MANDEIMTRYYTKEEEFLEEFGYGGVVGTAREVIGYDAWRPRHNADNDFRDQVKNALKHKYFPGTFYFSSAAIYHRPNRTFSSAQIILESCDRLVNIRVRQSVDMELSAEIIVDKPCE